MKTYLVLISVLLITVLTAGRCKKSPINSTDELPAETQTGANTFGCLVNGTLFKPGGALIPGGSLQCNFQLLPESLGGGYYFVLIGRNQTGGGNTLKSVGLFADSVKIEEGLKYILKTRVDGNVSASYLNSLTASTYERYTTDGLSNSGELWIKKLDTVNQIVCGTFWFDAVSDSGKVVKITQGRFDVRYTR